MSELKLCPFCGSEPESTVKTTGSVICVNENCRNYWRLFSEEEWNTRPIEDAKDVEIERLKKENKELKNICEIKQLHEIYMRGWNDCTNMITKQFQDYCTKIRFVFSVFF